MKSSEFITESKTDQVTKKISSELDKLSNEEVVLALNSLTSNIVDESSEDMAKQKQEGKRIYGGSENFIAYDDESRTGQRFKETPAGLEVTNVQYKPDNDTRRGATFNAPSQAEIKSATKQDGVSRSSPKKIDDYLKTLSAEEKEALAILIKKEAKQRNLNSNDIKPKPKAEPEGTVADGVIGCFTMILMLAGLIGGIELVYDFVPDYDAENTSKNWQGPYDQHYKIPSESIDISTSSPRKVGFGSILELDISLKNRNPYPVKDIKIKCTHRGKSNTVVDTTSTTIYDVIPAKGTLRLNDHNMGFMHSQTEYVSCKVTGAIRR